MHKIIIGSVAALALAAGAGAEGPPGSGVLELGEMVYEGWAVDDVPAAVNGFAYDAERGLVAYALDEKRFAFGSLFRGTYEVLKPGLKEQWGFAVAFDTRGRPHYFQQWGSDQPGGYEYGFWDGAKWVITKGDFPFEGGYVSNTSLVVSRTGQLHLAFIRTEREPESDIEESSIYYGNYPGGVWEFEELASVTSALYTREELSLGVDSTAVPHVCYCFNEKSYTGLRYAVRRDGRWATEVIDPGDDNTSVSLALDSTGRPHVAYCDESRGDLKYARREDGGWAVETVDAPGWCGPGASLVLDEKDVPVIAYYEDGPLGEDRAFYRVKVARRSKSGWRVAPIARIEREYKYLPAEPTGVTYDAEGRTYILFEESVGYEEKMKVGHSVNAEWGPSPEEPALGFRKAEYEPEISKWEPGRDLPYPELARLFALPESDADVIYEKPWDGGEEIEVIDAVSLRRTSDCPIYGGEVYETWYKGRVGDLVGWSQDWSACFLLEFTEAYEPLREGPSFEAAAVTPEAHKHAQFNDKGVKPRVAAGTLIPLNAAFKGWLCVGYSAAGGWLPATTQGLKIYRRVFSWYSGVYEGNFVFFLPAEEEVTSLVIENEEFLHGSRLSQEDPVVTITTADGDFACLPKFATSYGGHEGGSALYFVRWPGPVKRDDITAITFETGVPARRFRVTVDPREAWAEYDAER
jgi:hypothetical protein